VDGYMIGTPEAGAARGEAAEARAPTAQKSAWRGARAGSPGIRRAAERNEPSRARTGRGSSGQCDSVGWKDR